jgi:hypothetical protein
MLIDADSPASSRAAAHSFFELRAQPSTCCRLVSSFLRRWLADPLVARERRYVFPSRQCLRVGRERLLEIGRKIVYDSSGNFIEPSRKLKDQAPNTRVQLGFRDLSSPIRTEPHFGGLFPDSRLFGQVDHFRIARDPTATRSNTYYSGDLGTSHR